MQSKICLGEGEGSCRVADTVAHKVAFLPKTLAVKRCLKVLCKTAAKNTVLCQEGWGVGTFWGGRDWERSSGPEGQGCAMVSRRRGEGWAGAGVRMGAI